MGNKPKIVIGEDTIGQHKLLLISEDTNKNNDKVQLCADYYDPECGQHYDGCTCWYVVINKKIIYCSLRHMAAINFYKSKRV